jgi:hypothetical protein
LAVLVVLVYWKAPPRQPTNVKPTIDHVTKMPVMPVF